jgi:hypothetical protein
MTDVDDFLDWVRTSLYDAKLALHNGDAAPRWALWSRIEPARVLGAWRNAFGQQELDDLITGLARQFSNCTSYRFEMLSYDVVGGHGLHGRPGAHHRVRERRTAELRPPHHPGLPPRGTAAGRSPTGTGTP